MNKLREGLLLAGLGLAMTPMTGQAAGAAWPTAPASVQRAATQMADACRQWPIKDDFGSLPGKVLPIDPTALKDRGICEAATRTDGLGPSHGLLILLGAIGFCAMYGFLVGIIRLGEYARALFWLIVSWRRRRQFT